MFSSFSLGNDILKNVTTSYIESLPPNTLELLTQKLSSDRNWRRVFQPWAPFFEGFDPLKAKLNHLH